jgi:hypothetical protein
LIGGDEHSLLVQLHLPFQAGARTHLAHAHLLILVPVDIELIRRAGATDQTAAAAAVVLPPEDTEGLLADHAIVALLVRDPLSSWRLPYGGHKYSTLGRG